MLKPEHLRTLVEVVQLGSFAAAANRLGYTSSAVSQQMAALERTTGVKLFERSAHSVLPTSAAEVLAGHAKVVLMDIERMVATVQAVHRNSGRRIHVGIFPSFAGVLTDALRGMDPEERAGIRVSVAECSQLIPRLGAGGEMDAAIVYQVANSGLSWPSALSRRWIAEDRYKVVLPRDWCHLEPYRVEQLVDLPWIMHHPASGDASFFDGVFARWGLNPRVVCHSDDFKITMAMIGAGMGAALVPDLALRGHGPDVVVADVPWLNTSRSIFSLVRPDRETIRLRSLLDALTV
ncbi:LysR family transcriptional regulator [Sphaerisporangium siamense]|uniref:DNA-binding transcriptional LysR family regulator n=1 Tax=Sphaerisporangium siamense TaxID=795645 RepID=A0A7W7D1J6_9ACTN|nr:LysR family transcriptional regulator [Sphaerisporangium siamense]MBB4698532.1 DNA-binding transcriptional LysR family regulator [Sphaerisporangium siamense]GII85407.1 LysR family transcriptional regulator [Sphaerisporangium siamense]